jgi:hypothetical protein
MYITLPDAIDRLLEIKEDTVFETQTEVPVGEPIAEEEMEIESEEKGEDIILPSALVPSQRLLVLLDCTENQFYRGRVMPVIQEMEFPNKSEFSREFQPVLFMPLNSKEVQNFRVLLVDEFGREVNYNSSKTTVTLFFRPRFK